MDHLAVCAVDLGGRVRARTEVASATGTAPRPGARPDSPSWSGRWRPTRYGRGCGPPGSRWRCPVWWRAVALVVRAPNLGWQGVDVGPALRAALPGLPLTVDNEANLGALAELWRGGHDPAPPTSSMSRPKSASAPRWWSTGGCCAAPTASRASWAMCRCGPKGPRAPCGGRGCLEQYAGEEAVLRAGGRPEQAAASTRTRGRIALLAERAADGDRGCGARWTARARRSASRWPVR